MAFLRVLTALAAVLGFTIMAVGILAAKGAPQEAAAAAIGLAVAVIPYVFLRALAGFSALTAEQVRDAMIAALNQSRAPQSDEREPMK